MKIQTEELRAAFGLLGKVPQLDMLECSRFVRCQSGERSMDLQLTSTLAGFSSVKVKEGLKLKFHLDRAALAGFLAAAHGDEVTLQTGDKLTLQQGRIKLEVAKPADVSGYGHRPNGKGSILEVPPETFAKLQALAKYIPQKSIDERYSALQAVRGLGWLATDGLSIAVWKTPVSSSIAIPGALWQAMKEEDEFSIHEDIAVCSTSSGVLYQPLHADLKLFPIEKVKAVAEGAFSSKPLAEFEAEDWLNALNYFKGFPAEDAAVNCELTKSQMLLKVSVPGIKAETTVPAKISEGGSKMHWPLAKLKPWSDAVDSKLIRLSVSDTLSVFTTETKKDLLAILTEQDG